MTLFLRLLSLSASGALMALAVFAIVGIWGKWLPHAWRHYIWLVVLLRWMMPFAPPHVNLMNALARQTINSEHLVYQVTNISQPANAIVPYAIPTEAGVADRFAWEQSRQAPMETLAQVWDYAWVVWLGVSMMLFVRTITNYHSFARFIRAGWKPIEDPVFLDALDEVCGMHGIRKPLPLYVNPLAASPMLVGLLSPVIVLPTSDLISGLRSSPPAFIGSIRLSIWSKRM